MKKPIFPKRWRRALRSDQPQRRILCFISEDSAVKRGELPEGEAKWGPLTGVQGFRLLILCSAVPPALCTAGGEIPSWGGELG